MKKVKISLWLLFYFYTNQCISQSIEDHYSFVKKCYEDSCYRENDPSFIIIKMDDIELRYKNKNKYKEQKIILYNSKNKIKIDSFFINTAAIYPQKGLVINNCFYFFKFVDKKDYLCKINFSDFSIKDSKVNFSDSLSRIGNNYKNSFLLYDDNGDYKSDKNTFLKLYSYNPVTNQLKLLYNFKDIKPNPYEGLPFNPGISSIIEVKGKDKILVERSIWDGGKSDAVYYILDLITLKVEEVTDTKFSKLVEAPRKKFQSSPYYHVTVYCDPMYDYFYYDITDTLAYLKIDDDYGFIINEKDKTKSEYVSYPQDAFVLNADYEVIDQVLNRERILDNFSEGAIYENGKKKWLMLDIETDSYDTYSMNIAIKYPLEKAFYNIYYNKELSDKELRGFDQYELLLLKNFIYAKYNYKFKNPFYEAYYNTFSFYHDFQTWDAGKKKLERRKKVDKYFTKEDNKNLALILRKIK